jgi:hypothetical protein
MGPDGETAREVLRVFELGTMPPFWQDIDVEAGAERAYATVESDRSYRVEVGLRTAGGRFIPLAISNTVTTPPAEPSADTAVHWVVLETGRPPRPAEAPASWEGQRVPIAATATALTTQPEAEAEPVEAEAEAAEPVGSSEQMPKLRPPPLPHASNHTIPNSCMHATECSSVCTSGGTQGHLLARRSPFPCKNACLLARSILYCVYSKVLHARSCSTYIIV